MGGKPVAAIVCPRGVSIRDFKHERRIQIAFSFRGIECRELLAPGAVTKSALTYASGLRVEILRKIADQEFVYSIYFPGSDRAKQFEGAAKRVVIGDLLEAQLATYRRQCENKQLSPSTLEMYTRMIRSERMSFWREKTLAEATPSTLRAWIGGMDATAKFVRNLLTPLRSVFEDALNDDRMAFNPFERIALSKLLKQSAKPSKRRADPFDADERAALLDHAKPAERAMVQFWFECGLRPGELQALRWSRIDFDAKTARIDLNQVARTEKAPKTAAGIRVVDLNLAAMAALESQKAASLLAGEHVWLNTAKGGAWETDSQLRRVMWIPLCKRAKVRYRTPYQVRHTYASALLTSGTNPWYVAQQLGHVDVTMVFKTYGKFIPQDYQKPKAVLKVISG